MRKELSTDKCPRIREFKEREKSPFEYDFFKKEIKQARLTDSMHFFTSEDTKDTR